MNNDVIARQRYEAKSKQSKNSEIASLTSFARNDGRKELTH